MHVALSGDKIFAMTNIILRPVLVVVYFVFMFSCKPGRTDDKFPFDLEPPKQKEIAYGYRTDTLVDRATGKRLRVFFSEQSEGKEVFSLSGMIGSDSVLMLIRNRSTTGYLPMNAGRTREMIALVDTLSPQRVVKFSDGLEIMANNREKLITLREKRSSVTASFTRPMVDSIKVSYKRYLREKL
jgi:hypothetical protein